MNIRLRRRINSRVGALDRAHNRPFILGAPVRVPITIHPGADGRLTFAERASLEAIIDGALHGATVRRWNACVRVDRECWCCGYVNCASHCYRPSCGPDTCDHRTWAHGEFSDDELFEAIP